MTVGEPLPQPEVALWSRCTRALKAELTEQEFNTWVRPLQAVDIDGELRLLAPNRFVVNWVEKHYLEKIREFLDDDVELRLEVGSRQSATAGSTGVTMPSRATKVRPIASRLDPNFSFDAFVEGKSNQLAKAAAIQVSENPGMS